MSFVSSREKNTVRQEVHRRTKVLHSPGSDAGRKRQNVPIFAIPQSFELALEEPRISLCCAATTMPRFVTGAERFV